jgi:hypothetical protein
MWLETEHTYINAASICKNNFTNTGIVSLLINFSGSLIFTCGVNLNKSGTKDGVQLS